MRRSRRPPAGCWSLIFVAIALCAREAHASPPLTPEDRERFVQATRAFQAGDVRGAYAAAKPLFDAYPDNQDIQDLRCQLATVRWLDKDALLAECAASTRLAAAAGAPAPTSIAPAAASAPAPAPASAPPPAAAQTAWPESSTPSPSPPTPAKPPTPRFLLVAAGVGISYPLQGGGGKGTGFYADVEYGVKPTTWLVPKAYAGVLITGADSSSCDGGATPCDVSAKIGFAGGKVRLIAPIPYVAPFIEGGIGLAFGALTSRTPAADDGTANVAYQVPIGAGLVLGQMFELGVDYLLHPGAGQLDGAFALSLTFPLG